MSADCSPITACRLCGGAGLDQYIEFGDVPLGNNLLEDAEQAAVAPSYPLEVRRCDSCAHFQLGHAVNPQLLYATNYTYLSGIGASFVRHFAEYAEWAQATCKLSAGELVVDVGSNDGTCLKAFQRRGLRVCGVDPASLAAQTANADGIETINDFFDEAVVQQIIARHGQADYVTSHNVLAHVDDLAATFRNIHALLKDGGWFGFEIGYFGAVLRSGAFDTIYHEHLDYHHAAPLARHLTALGFDLVHLGQNTVQGGSLRLLLRKTGDGRISEQAQKFLEQESNSVLYDTEFLAGWKEGIERQMREFRGLLAERAGQGRVIVAYGAPTKATLLMKMAGLDGQDVAFVLEDNSHKSGRYLPGTAVPIRPSSALNDIIPDVVVILAWNFADDIVSKLAVRLPAGTEVIVPLPDLQVSTL